MPPLISSLSQRALPDVCLTPKCVEIAESILSSVNLNVDPCSDFFQYTCGNWLLSDEIKDTVQGSSTARTMTIKNLDMILGFLEGTFEDLYDTIKSVDPLYNTQSMMDSDRKNFQLIKTYYDACLDTERNLQLGSTPLFPFLAQIENNLFPITENLVSERLSETIAALTLRGVPSIVDIGADINIYDHDYFLLNILPGLTDNLTIYEHIDQLGSYRYKVIDLLTHTVGDVSELDQDYGEFVLQESQKNNFTLWSASKIEIAASNFVNFEMKLAKLVNVEAISHVFTDHPSTLKEIESINPTIDWNMLVSTLVSPEYPTPDLPIKYVKEYTESLEELLTTTSVKVLQEYFIIRSIQATSSKLSIPESVQSSTVASFSEYIPQTDTFKAPTGKEPESPSQRSKCAKETSLKFYDIFGRFFSLSSLGATDEVKRVEDMVSFLHATWLHDMLPETSWADEETKAGIIEKIENLILKIGVRNKKPDWRDPSSLELLYDNVTLDDSDGYFYNSVVMAIQENTKNFKSLLQKKNRSDYNKEDMGPYVVNAFYDPFFNSLEILIGMIQQPFYSVDYPEYLNYGAIGGVIGHELVHALDNSGKNYNATGYLEDWFTESSAKAYDEKAQCFVEQYENFTMTGLNNTEYPLDGDAQLGENIADSGGLNIAFRAYQNHVLKQGPDQLLPGLEHLTPEQMFFVNHGLISCEITALSDAKESAVSKVHSPFYYRVIGGLQNDANFAKAFNCPVGSPMNPEKKCSIW
ncbi:uncharacterized protein EV154DRAFT_462639 [Mucor mucedo]|uniref:uncharacterized protein n=1 Tax=Mucor mucedo TaxID=29922 RepID=UPI00221E89AA|nr:uncharacterized protein EV154DRAFT_462639 [Mucor mucedo]KAI7892362.1 hypothetical protein EV154DRAFT_462639 [Mucor mucedo]